MGCVDVEAAMRRLDAPTNYLAPTGDLELEDDIRTRINEWSKDSGRFRVGQVRHSHRSGRLGGSLGVPAAKVPLKS
jgi:hypothetical protein